MSELPFLRPNNILLCIYTTFCLSIHVTVDTWVASTLAIMNNASMTMAVLTHLILATTLGGGHF